MLVFLLFVSLGFFVCLLFFFFFFLGGGGGGGGGALKSLLTDRLDRNRYFCHTFTLKKSDSIYGYW